MQRSDLVDTASSSSSHLGVSRQRVLDALQAAGAPVGVDEVAAQVGLHPNTARFHLAALTLAGLVERRTEERARPGRPRALYSATDRGERAGRRSYRLLAEILTSYLASQTDQPARAAEEAGEAWGRFLTERTAPFRRVDAETATAKLVAALDEIGFAPEAVTVNGHRQVLMHHCPFREAAEEHGDVVCAIHLGLTRGVLAELSSPLEAQRIDVRVEPSLCVTRLAVRKVGRRRAVQRAG